MIIRASNGTSVIWPPSKAAEAQLHAPCLRNGFNVAGADGRRPEPVESWPLQVAGVGAEETHCGKLGGAHLVEAGGQPEDGENAQNGHDEDTGAAKAKLPGEAPEEVLDPLQNLVYVYFRLRPRRLVH